MKQIECNVNTFHPIPPDVILKLMEMQIQAVDGIEFMNISNHPPFKYCFKARLKKGNGERGVHCFSVDFEKGFLGLLFLLYKYMTDSEKSKLEALLKSKRLVLHCSTNLNALK